MASGYDIGVSGSTALSNSTPQTSDAGTVFNFSSPGASGDWYDQTQTANPSATAVATTKSPGSTTDVGTDGDSPVTVLPTSSVSPVVYIVAALAVSAIVVTILILHRK